MSVFHNLKIKFNSLTKRLFDPVDIATLVLFRMAFGAIMFWEVCRYFLNGWIGRYFISPTIHFTYYGFSWVRPWPGLGMYLHFIVLGVLALFIMVGAYYRICSIIFFLGFTYVFLLDQVRYLNHFYLICLVSFLMIFLPTHREFSVDAILKPSIRSKKAPTWALFILCAQIGLVYFYGGIAKINADWLRGEPLRMWLANRTHLPVLGQFLDHPLATYFFSYSGLLFDLLFVPALLWKTTRFWALASGVLFNLTNAYLFHIGIFPWFMLASTALFFSPGWPRKFLERAFPDQSHSLSVDTNVFLRSKKVLILLAIYISFQILMPLRHFLYPGSVHWTEEGHRFSWHMKLRSKKGKALFYVTDPQTHKTLEVTPKDTLNRMQQSELPVKPDMLLQFGHYLAQKAREQGIENPEVRVLAMVSLNGRKPQLLIDPTTNLALEARNLRPAKWIMPLTEPLTK